MSLPGLEQLAAIHPGFAAEARRLGENAWRARDRTPRETAACFLGLDLAHGLLDLPLRLHATMARQLGVSGGYLGAVLVSLTPVVGYPCVAQALVNTADLLTAPGDGDQPTMREQDFAMTAWTSATGVDAKRLPVAPLIAEYGGVARASEGNRLRPGDSIDQTLAVEVSGGDRDPALGIDAVEGPRVPAGSRPR